MGGTEDFYLGSSYSTRKENFGNLMEGFEPYRAMPSMIGLATDARTANQIKAATDKINTGTNVVEIGLVTPDVADSIPNQHLEELSRLRKITGIDMTVHGPLVEPTGVSKQGWEETDRHQAERQILTSMERAHKVNPDGNVVFTVHASNGLPEPESKVIIDKDGKKKEIVTGVWVVDERTGQFSSVTPKVSHFKSETDIEGTKQAIEKQNNDAWFRELQHVNFNASQGGASLQRAFMESDGRSAKPLSKEQTEGLLKAYSDFAKGKDVNAEKAHPGENYKVYHDKMSEITHGDIYMRESYVGLQELFNKAYDATKRKIEHGKGEEKEKAAEDLEKLNSYREKIKPMLKDLEDPRKVLQLSEEITQGVNVLRQIETPQLFRPLKDFAIEKSAKTFGNVAFQSFKKFGDTSPIMSIENPPVGMGLSRAEEIKEVIEGARGVFVENAMKEGLSRDEAKKQASKLIGATWDVGHINMVKKFGYDNKTLKKETETIAPYVKHMHLSDNFGLEHTELPMGMGNVPMAQHEAILRKQFGDKIKDIKKIVETGNWYQHFQTTPFMETLEAFGSPVYGMKMSPYWNQASGMTSGYFAGFGMNPDVHHSIYGSGFSNLPSELGGQMPGKSRMSGNPME
jgi:sugar phosphate isomerase/epimerase